MCASPEHGMIGGLVYFINNVAPSQSVHYKIHINFDFFLKLKNSLKQKKRALPKNTGRIQRVKHENRKEGTIRKRDIIESIKIKTQLVEASRNPEIIRIPRPTLQETPKSSHRETAM